MKEADESRGSLVIAGAVLGIGLGGFVDGILFHQILQIHNMLSAVRPPNTLVNAEINMFWDGVFHAFSWLTTVLGIGLLWRLIARPRGVFPTRVFVGSLLLGWGLFNLVEGIVDHHLLGIHHVIERPRHLVYDLAFLAFGAGLVGFGSLLVRGFRSRQVTTR